MEDFNPQYYQHLLSSLTTNSRALITELTTIAEQHSIHSKHIVSLIEERIKKCLPQYKLYSFYLLDSIVKNIGNPYNLYFENGLYKLFTESYLIVTDNMTRQHLINLFKTWLEGKTNAGLDIFSKSVLTKIESFIVRATTINQGGLASVEAPKSTPPPTVPATASSNTTSSNTTSPNTPSSNTPSLKVPPGFTLPNVIVPEHFLRECNYLLQYVIHINRELEPFEATKFYKKNNTIRNSLIMKINELSEELLRQSRPEFEAKINYYHETLVEIRSKMDEQNFKQNIFILKQTKPILEANPKYVNLLNNPFELVENEDELYFFLEKWGLPVTNEELYMPIVMETTPEAMSSNTDTVVNSSTERPENGNTERTENSNTEKTENSNSDNPPSDLLGLGVNFDDINFELKRKPEPLEKPLKKVRFDV